MLFLIGFVKQIKNYKKNFKKIIFSTPKKSHGRLYHECGQYVLPEAAESEFLIEKSPLYAERFLRRVDSNRVYDRQSLKDLQTGNYETVKRAVQMKKINPNAKLFIHVTGWFHKFVVY